MRSDSIFKQPLLSPHGEERRRRGFPLPVVIARLDRAIHLAKTMDTPPSRGMTANAVLGPDSNFKQHFLRMRIGKLRRPCFCKGAGAPAFPFVPRETRGWRAGRAQPSFQCAIPFRTAAPSGAPSRRFPYGAGPRFLRSIGALVSASSSRGSVSDPGRCPGAARERGYEPRARAPHPVPPSRRLMTTPFGGWGYSERKKVGHSR